MLTHFSGQSIVAFVPHDLGSAKRQAAVALSRDRARATDGTPGPILKPLKIVLAGAFKLMFRRRYCA
jgi:hypothetical protein